MIAITAPAVLLEKSTAERVQAEENSRLQGSFFANVSHELRTPLTLILSPLESMLHDPDLVLPPHVRDYLASMQRSTNRLLRLINNLLDLAKVDAGKVFLRYEPLDLGAFVTSTLAAFEPLAENKRIALRAELAPTDAIYADADRMDIVLQNLVANAMKFTSEGGSVVVRVRDAADQVHLEVEDTGIGIAQKDLKVIFDRFGQADGSVTRRFGGTGIGLALVKDLVDSARRSGDGGERARARLDVPGVAAEGHRPRPGRFSWTAGRWTCRSRRSVGPARPDGGRSASDATERRVRARPIAVGGADASRRSRRRSCRRSPLPGSSWWRTTPTCRSSSGACSSRPTG